MPVYLSMDHGGFDEERYAGMLRAAAHPDLAWILETMIRDMREKNTQVTRLREQLAARDELAVAGIATHMKEADIGPFAIVMRPIDERSVSTLGLCRRAADDALYRTGMPHRPHRPERSPLAARAGLARGPRRHRAETLPAPGNWC